VKHSINPISGFAYLFTFNHSSVGDAVYNNGDSTGTPGDYTTAIRFEVPSDSDTVNYVDFKYAVSAISVGTGGLLSVSNSQFADNEGAFAADTVSAEDSELGDLADVCTYPYSPLIEIDISNDWFGSNDGSGQPGISTDLSGDVSTEVGDTIPDDETGLSALYDYDFSLVHWTVNGGDNTIPWAMFSCGIPDTDLDFEFPVTPVNLGELIDGGGVASSPLWSAPYSE